LFIVVHPLARSSLLIVVARVAGLLASCRSCRFLATSFYHLALTAIDFFFLPPFGHLHQPALPGATRP
jgi:hypothetical protein